MSEIQTKVPFFVETKNTSWIEVTLKKKEKNLVFHLFLFTNSNDFGNLAWITHILIGLPLQKELEK